MNFIKNGVSFSAIHNYPSILYHKIEQIANDF